MCMQNENWQKNPKTTPKNPTTKRPVSTTVLIVPDTVTVGMAEMPAGHPCNYQCRFLLAAPGMGTSTATETSEVVLCRWAVLESLWFRGVTCGTSETRTCFVFGVDKKRCVNVLL